MAFLVFERFHDGAGQTMLRPTGRRFHLAGHNLIYHAWNNHGQPVNQGWHVSANGLISIHSGGCQTYATRRLIIDDKPNSGRRIGLVELLDVYAYTWGDNAGNAIWTPLMLRMRDVYYRRYDPEITRQERRAIMGQLQVPEPDNNAPDVVTFLYLQGPWNFGMGRINGAFLHSEARAYFGQFF